MVLVIGVGKVEAMMRVICIMDIHIFGLPLSLFKLRTLQSHMLV